MGNTFGYHKNLNVFIETERPYYNSGSSIEGTIFVEVKNNCTFNALYLRIEGTSKFYVRKLRMQVVRRKL
jgi:hypothetical protein